MQSRKCDQWSLLVLLGMHRSGTSALAGVFHTLGFDAGRNLLPPNERNARGYFEELHLNQRLDTFLGLMGRSWYDERELPDNWILSNASAAAAEDLVKIFQTQFNLAQPTVVKDPRLCRVLPLLQSIWRSSEVTEKYVFSLRPPLAVIASLARRDEIPAQRAALLYVAYLLEAELHTRGQPRAFVQYNNLLKDWRAELAQVRSALDLNQVLPDDVLEAHGGAVDAFLSAKLNHFVEETDVPSGVAIELAHEVFELLCSPMDDEALVKLDEVRKSWKCYLNSLEPWISDSATLNRIKAELPRTLFDPSAGLAEEASRHATSDIYWATEELDFDESRKISAKWAYGQQMTQRFLIPDAGGRLAALRYDITDRPAQGLIDRVWVEDPQGGQRWAWQTNEPLFGHESADMHVLGLNEQGQLRVMATGFDPHAPLEITGEVLREMKEGWAVCISWRAKMPTQDLAELMGEFTGAQSALRSAEAQLDTLKRENSGLTQRARTEIVRAEAQLALLKELWLEDGPLERL